MRANRTVILGMSLAILIVFGSVCTANTSASNATDGEAGQIHFSGKVVDAQGVPIKGARVRFYTAYSQDVKLTENATTGMNGTFSFGVSAKRDGYRHGYVVAEKGELAIGLANWRMTEDDKTEITLGPAKELAGVVLDRNDKPVSGVQISISMLQIRKGEQRRALHGLIGKELLAASTDAGGTFSLGRIPAEATAEFLLRKDGRATVGTFERAAYSGKRYQYLAGQKDIKLVLPVESRIEGAVVEKGTGRPVAKAKVTIVDEQNRSLPGLESILSNEDGTFSMDALPPGNHLVKYVPPDDGPVDWIAEPTSVTLEAGRTATDVKVELRKGGILEVLVRDVETRTPIEGARVSVYDQRRKEWYRGQTESDGIGRIRLLPGTYQSGSAHKEGYSSLGRQKPITIEDGATKRLEWKLTPLPTIRGVVRDQNGKPIKGVALKICPVGGLDGASSDDEGKFEMSWDSGIAASPGRSRTYLLVCRHMERNLGAVAIIPEGERTLDVELKPAVTIKGKVVDSDAKGIADATITVMLRQTGWSSTMTRDKLATDADGNFELKAIPVEHRYELRAIAEGYGGKRIEIHADDAVNHLLEIEPSTLPRANLSVSGLVVDTQGNPIAKARINSYGFGDGQPERLVTQSDSQGRFTLEGVCEGTVDLRVDVSQKGKRLSARAKAYGGATGIKLVAREGRAVLQHFSMESYEQIIRDNEKAIAGVAVDESGSPVAGVPVGVRCQKKKREDGKFSWMFSSFPDLKATTDKQGRFAIPTEEDGQYNLIFSPDSHAAVIAYDVPVGKKDLKVTLPAGGTITGRLARMVKGKNIPIPNAEVKIEQPDRASYTHLGFDRDQTTTTDSQGRFQFEYLQTKIRPRDSMRERQWKPIARVWQISYGETSKTMAFYNETKIENFELLVRPNPAKSQGLIGAPLPFFDGIKIDLAPNHIKGKMVLVCFFDMEQRPSRNTLRQLNAKAQQLKTRGVVVAAVQASKSDGSSLAEWAKKYNISFPVGMVQGDVKEAHSTWSARSLPWLILTDNRHVVAAEGFALGELDAKINAAR